MRDVNLIISAILSSVAWIYTFIRVTIFGRNPLPYVIISTCFTLIFFCVAISWLLLN